MKIRDGDISRRRARMGFKLILCNSWRSGLSNDAKAKLAGAQLVERRVGEVTRLFCLFRVCGRASAVR